jgi:hypothetical protein
MPHAAATVIFFSQYKYDYTLRYPLIRTSIKALYVVSSPLTLSHCLLRRPSYSSLYDVLRRRLYRSGRRRVSNVQSLRSSHKVNRIPTPFPS